MCGLFFRYSNRYTNIIHDTCSTEALNALLHRGPDDKQIVIDNAATIGHTRLSILDVSDSRQPMRSPDKRYVLAFNGEIYNFRELRNSLSEEWVFHTEGDTEVLLAGLILRGEKFISSLEGMWAFAFWDTLTDTLLLSRDRLGKKPLYYTQIGREFFAASELPALRKICERYWQQDLDSVADYFRYGYYLPGYTMWEGVREVLPAHNLRWRPGDPPSQHQYWYLVPRAGSSNREIDDEYLTSTLESAVKKRLVADVEIGAFLSGGIDSSLLCALAQRQMHTPLKTYTASFNDSAYDEAPFAGLIANFLGTNHHIARFPEFNPKDLTSLLANHVGQAFSDSSLLPTSLVSKAASTEVKVVLSGDGADELFGGYQRYQARIILRWYTRLPAALRTLGENLIRALPEPSAHHSRSLLKKSHLFLDMVSRYGAEQPYIAPLMFSTEQYARLFPDLKSRGHVAPGLTPDCELSDLQRMLYADTLIYLPQDILLKVDRASMAYGLETRSPFLDHSLVELAFTKNSSSHLGIGSGKRWLRRAFKNTLPKAVWNRRKQGFAVPIHQWFRGPLSEAFREKIVNSNSAYWNSDEAKKLFDEHLSGKRDHGYRLWLLFVYSHFC